MIDFQKLWSEIEQIDGRKLSAKKIYEIMKDLDEPVKETGRRTGRWELSFKCSSCGANWDFDGGQPSSFCPVCGAEMENGE